MDKRYQVFISSTYSDLRDERQAVMQTLMEMDCIPAGMELFPAADEEQWLFIQKIINDCDYYILILGGRYGSLTEDGVSYTEKEFDYAVSKGLKVIALVHETPNQLSFAKVEASELAQRNLSAFREKVTTGRLVKFWNSSGELPGLVALSLQKTIKMYPAPGWVRGDQMAGSEVLAQINNLRIENDELRKIIFESKEKHIAIEPDISYGDDPYLIPAAITSIVNRSNVKKEITFNETWDGVFSKIGPNIISQKDEASVRSTFQRSLRDAHNISDLVSLSKETMDTIALQLTALGLIDIFPVEDSKGSFDTFWKITELGRDHLMKIRLIRKTV